MRGVELMRDDHVVTDFRAGSSSGIWPRAALGLGLGLLVGMPIGIALRAANYPSDWLYTWWWATGIACLGVLIVAAVVATRSTRMAMGLVLGVAGVLVAPALVVMDILVHSE